MISYRMTTSIRYTQPNWPLLLLSISALLCVQIGVTIYAIGLFLQPLTQSAGMPGIPESINTVINATPAGENDQIRRSVAAQEAMATFSFWMLAIAFLTTLVTTAGTVAIFRQIKFGQETLILSREVATQANKTSERQLRAYVCLSYNPDGGSGGEFVFLIHNSGQTPAIKIFYHTTIIYWSVERGEVYSYETEDYDWCNLPANLTHKASVSLPPPGLIYNREIAPKHDYIQIGISCTYHTVFGTEHQSDMKVNRRGFSEFWMDDESVEFT